MPSQSHLRIFLAHSKEDKSLVREIYFLLGLDGFDPWMDELSLKPGQDWELEIDKAISASHIVALFISPSGSSRAGYLQKETILALDSADRQPEGTIFTIPIQLGECDMPRRLSHLHWLKAPANSNEVTRIYSALQTSLLERAVQLGVINSDYIYDMPMTRIHGTKGELFYPLQPGHYLVRGQNPNGGLYYGTADLSRRKRKYQMVARIGGIELKYIQESRPLDLEDYLLREPVVLRGEYEVVYEVQDSTGVCLGKWGTGGIEELIPASPFSRDWRPSRRRY